MSTAKWYHRIFPKNRPLRWAMPLALLLGLVGLQLAAPGWSERLEAWTVDARFTLRGPETPRHPVQIIALDDASFKILNEQQGENIRTWPRARWAELVSKVSAYGPRLILLDVVFDTPGWDAGGDEALAQALRDSGKVILAAQMEQTSGAAYTAQSFGLPIQPLQSSAAALGMADFTQDADGAIRRAHLLFEQGDTLLPALGLAVATLYRGAAVDVARADLGDDLSLPIHFRGPEGTFPTTSLYEVWMGQADPALFRDAIVIIGYTTLIEQDRHLTPFTGAQKMPGVEVQANVIDTLLAGDWLHRPPAWLAVALVTAACLLAWGLSSLPSPGLGALSLLGAGAAYLAAGVLLFNGQDFLLPLAAPLIAAALLGGAVVLERVIFAERDKRLLRQRFAGVMSPERLQAVLDNWQALMDTERPEKAAAALFVDIRGFTHASEVLMHQGRSPEMVRFLNAYVDALGEAAFLEGGVIYRTFGDGLLILFGVPEALPGHPLKAVRAAVRMALAAQELQDLWPLRDEACFQMGVGVNEGADDRCHRRARPPLRLHRARRPSQRRGAHREPLQGGDGHSPPAWRAGARVRHHPDQPQPVRAGARACIGRREHPAV